jgi:ankyrin repeat protein
MIAIDVFVDNEFTFACKEGNLEKAKLLLESNSFSDEYLELLNKNKYIDISFLISCFNGNLEIVKLLLESNKFSNEFYTNLDYFYGKAYFYRDGYGVINSLTYAVKQGKIKIVKLLLESDKFYKDFKIITNHYLIPQLDRYTQAGG